VFSFFLLDYYRHGEPRPTAFNKSAFDFNHAYGNHGDDFAIVVPENPEQMTAYRLGLLERLVAQAGLEFVQVPIPGLWSGGVQGWVCAQDLIILQKPVLDADV
jgi:hypothetical protein